MSYPEAILDALPRIDKSWFNAEAGRGRLHATLTSPRIREIWKYTPIKSFVEAFAEPQIDNPLSVSGLDQPEIQATEFAALQGAELELVRGCLAGIDGARYPMADLSMLGSDGGQLIKVTGRAELPLTLRTAGAGSQPLIIDVAPGASVNIVEESVAQQFNTLLVYVRLGARAHVHHVRCALEASAMQWSLLIATLDADCTYELQQFQSGGRRRRTDCHFMLNGQGSRADITGAFLTEDGCHLDQQVIIEHKAPNTVSRQKFHGIATGKSRAVFNGRIHIHADAGGSDALLSNRNLSLNPGAEINTKPELEIYTDDVKCAHGATVGQLSEDSLFYLRSRGLSDVAARSILCKGFLRECISGPVAEKVSERFTAALQ
ncbi:MAG: SufD family Fe-S cluster assembly protein [Pseudomonadales bacterium]